MPSLPLSYYSDEPSHSPLKVSLFTRIQEMKNVLVDLSQIAAQPTSAKKRWLTENDEFLQRLLETITQGNPISWEEPDMDPDLMQLLMEYTAVLQDLVAVIQSISHAKKLKLSRAQSKRSHLA